MDSRSRDQSDSPKPKRLKTVASIVKFSGGNTLLHRLVLDSSHPHDEDSDEIYRRVVLLSLSNVPASAVNALNDVGFTALHLAVLKNNLKMVKKLLSCLVHIDINARCGRCKGNTALHLAVETGRSSILQELLEKGASIDIRNRADETALSAAMRLRSLDTLKILVSADVNQHPSFNILLSEAVLYDSSLEIVGFLLDRGADIDARDRNGTTPLHDAVSFGNCEIAEFLIDQGADIEARHVEGGTPLHFAANSSRLDCVKLLVSKGADLHARDEEGRTPFYDAVGMGSIECVVFLLDQGARLNAADVGGWTPLHVAAQAGHVDIVRALLDRGADVDARNADGKTPLDIAIERKNASCIDALENVM